MQGNTYCEWVDCHIIMDLGEMCGKSIQTVSTGINGASTGANGIYSAQINHLLFRRKPQQTAEIKPNSTSTCP